MCKSHSFKFIFRIACVTFWGIFGAFAHSEFSSAWISKVTPLLQERLISKSPVDISIEIKGSQVDDIIGQLHVTTNINAYVRHKEKSQIIHDALKHHNSIIQRNVLKILKSHPELGKIKTFWITPQIYVENTSLEAVENLVELDEVVRIDIEPEIQIAEVNPGNVGSDFRNLNTARVQSNYYNWGAEKIRVQEAWSLPWNTNGSGITVGIIDTGVLSTHEALRYNYKNDGKSWRDTHNHYYIPTDVYNHGTAVAGIILGRTNGIGIAPEANWIACKAYSDHGSSSISKFVECGEYVVCPTDAYGRNADCSKTVDVTSNSWGVGTPTMELEHILKTWAAVGIIGIAAIGNEGRKGCVNGISPGDSPNAIGVGATGTYDELAEFSSRGPSMFYNNPRILKPDVTAPGVNIYSADSRGNNLYSIRNGTSLASPYVVGVVALLKGVRPCASIDEIQAILRNTAVRDGLVTTGASCGGLRDNQWPNNHFGHGRIDAYSAMTAIY